MIKIFLKFLILIFIVNSIAKADNIKDFEIEGMSIGDSLLNFYSIEEIKNELDSYSQPYKNNEYLVLVFESKKNNTSEFDGFRFHVKSNDENYIIEMIGAYQLINFENCKEKKIIISNEIENIFGSETRKDYKIKNHAYDKSGNSKTISTYFILENGRTRIICTDWSKELTERNNWKDKITIGIYSNDFVEWLQNKAYK